MLTKIDLVILSHLRRNARKSLVNISKETKIPVSTIFDRLSRIESTAVKKYTSILDFSKLNHNLVVNYAIKTVKEKRLLLSKFLDTSPQINSVYRINNGFDMMVECIFMDLKQKEEFEEGLNRFVQDKKEFHVIEELKKEGFLTSISNLDKQDF